MQKIARDEVFRAEHPEIAEFAFDEKVTSVFADMLKRSVPGYGSILTLIAVLAKKYAIPNTKIYDLGCSLGAVSLAIANNVENKIIGVDVSEPMIKQANILVAQAEKNEQITLVCEDITKIPFEKSSVVALNLTLQFINPEERTPLLQKIHKSLVENGILILTEKLTDTSPNSIYTDIYYDFKRANGYNETEISQKRTALENVLITDTEDTHIERLKNAGFPKVIRVFQALNFRSFVAFK